MRLFARHGAKVVIADVDDDTLGNPLADFLDSLVSLEEDIENLIESSTSGYGRLSRYLLQQ